MSIPEAARLSGYAPFTLRMFCRQGEFPATKPRGDRHGWEIDAEAFRAWLKLRRIERSNQHFIEQ